ncbi:MAG: hypothetical protein ACRC33_07690 [Gemmataceae bacterium]
MKNAKAPTEWVVYRSPVSKEGPGTFICERAEWERLQQERPGQLTLVRAGIGSEAEAERVAREASGFDPGGSASSSGRRPHPGHRRQAYGSSIVGHTDRG